MSNKKLKKKKKEKMYLSLDDGEFVINEEYITESKAICLFYRCGFQGPLPAPIKGKSSRIIRKALEFCKKRGEIKNNHIMDETLLKQDLKAFDTTFLQHNHTDAIELADVACRLQIKSLYYLMRKLAADRIAEMTDDDIYKLFKIHYDENKTNDCDLGMMKKVVRKASWAFKPLM